jgi:hypothetical protein
VSGYDHSQPATTLVGGLGFGVMMVSIVGIVALLDAQAVPGMALVLGLALAVFVVLIVLFRRLRVTVADGVVTVAFGSGWPRRRIPVAEIREARPERNSWWWGWGIRLTPRGLMFNASGFDAVQLELTDRRRFRIGTDDPAGLVAAIEEARKFRS